jgi:hypothetical protein
VSFLAHFKHDGILQVAYTFSKLISNTDNTSSFQDGQGGLGLVQDYTNLKAEKSLSLQDVPQNLVINSGFDLPFGRGEQYLGNADRLLNAVVGGWRVNGITTFRSGLPIALQAAGNNLSTFGAGPIRPNYVGGCDRNGVQGSKHSATRANEWFNTACFTQPGPYSFGTESRVDSVMRSDNEANWDMSFNKYFDLTHGVRFKFGTEFFDIFNHPQFALPNSNLASPGFGQVGHQSNLPRTVQFEGRITF